MADEEVVIPPIEGEGAPPEPQEDKPPEANPAEESARKKGWKPKEEFDGDPEVWVDAEEFIKREPFFDKFKHQNKKIKELERTISGMTQHYNAAVANGVKNAIAQLQQRKETAIEDGDKELVRAIDAEIDRQKASPQMPVVNPDMLVINQWVGENKWFNSDPVAQAAAIKLDEKLKDEEPDVEVRLSRVKEEIEKRFPEHFPAKQKPTTQHPPPIEGARTPQKGQPKYDKSRLSPEQKTVYEHMVVRNKIMSHDQYFKDLEEAGYLE